MATIKWKPSAWQLFNDYLENARLAYGQKTAQHWESDIAHIYERLKLFPTSYPPEKSMASLNRLYRFCHLMNRRFKLIYFYDESEDVIYIMDIWDTKMNPQALIKRIK
ncbi:MAG: type II toxin-antitoxin system RelE/ParE family toxin [Prevotella sp.]|nr:type II toxin-antitoxin system RelE/ParE family toxin [Prevotella sp.]